MKTTTIALALLISLLGTIARSEDFGECVEAGHRTGELVAQQFCNVLEARYNKTFTTTSARGITPRLCEWAVAVSCRNNMAAWTSSNRPLCTQLVNENWDGAWEQWESTQLAGCPYEPQAATERCPQGAAVVRGRICSLPDGRSIAARNGVWWTFESKRVQDGETLYLMKADDGAVALLHFGELDIVSEY